MLDLKSHSFKEVFREMKGNSITGATKILLDIMFYVGIVVTLTLPVSFYFYGKYNEFFKIYYIQMVVIFMIAGVFAVLILYELRRIFKTVLNDDCFVKSNVRSLNRMGIYSFAIMLVMLCRLPMFFTPAVFVIVVVFLIAGLFSRVLAIVFDRAVEYKQENDFTI